MGAAHVDRCPLPPGHGLLDADTRRRCADQAVLAHGRLERIGDGRVGRHRRRRFLDVRRQVRSRDRRVDTDARSERRARQESPHGGLDRRRDDRLGRYRRGRRLGLGRPALRPGRRLLVRDADERRAGRSRLTYGGLDRVHDDRVGREGLRRVARRRRHLRSVGRRVVILDDRRRPAPALRPHGRLDGRRDDRLGRRGWTGQRWTLPPLDRQLVEHQRHRRTAGVPPGRRGLERKPHVLLGRLGSGDRRAVRPVTGLVGGGHRHRGPIRTQVPHDGLDRRACDRLGWRRLRRLSARRRRHVRA